MVSCGFYLLLGQLRCVVHNVVVNRLSSGHCRFMRDQEEIELGVTLVLNKTVVNGRAWARVQKFSPSILDEQSV